MDVRACAAAEPAVMHGAWCAPSMLRYFTFTTSPSRLYGNATHSRVFQPDSTRNERIAVRTSFAAMTASWMPRELRNARPARDSGDVMSSHCGGCTGCAAATCQSAPAVTRPSPSRAAECAPCLFCAAPPWDPETACTRRGPVSASSGCKCKV